MSLHPYVDAILERIRRNKNSSILVSGATGSGKTWLSLRLAEVLSEAQGLQFSADRFCVSPRDFIEKVADKSLPKGSVIVLDESGVSLNNRNWRSKANNSMAFLLQTFRNRNLIAIFLSPNMAFVDKASRKLMHFWIETSWIDMRRKQTWARCKLIKPQQHRDDLFYPYLKTFPDGAIVPDDVKRIGFKLASKQLRQDVDAKLDAFKEQVVQDGLAALQEDSPKLMTDNQRLVHYLNYKEGFGAGVIAKLLNKSSTTVHQTLKSIEKRGFPIRQWDKATHEVHNIEQVKQKLNTLEFRNNVIDFDYKNEDNVSNATSTTVKE